MMNEPYDEDVTTSFAPMTGRQLMQIALVGLIVGIVTWGLTWLVATYALRPSMCPGAVVQACTSSVEYGEMTAAILAAGMGLFFFVRLQVFRPLLVVIAATVSLWGVITSATSLPWYTTGLMSAALFMLAYAAFAWVVRIRLFWLAILCILVLVVAVRLMLSA